jgi:hypothetical protein
MSKFRVKYNSIVEKIRNTLQGETISADWDMVPDAGERGSMMPGWTRIKAPEK